MATYSTVTMVFNVFVVDFEYFYNVFYALPLIIYSVEYLGSVGKL